MGRSFLPEWASVFFVVSPFLSGYWFLEGVCLVCLSRSSASAGATCVWREAQDRLRLPVPERGQLQGASLVEGWERGSERQPIGSERRGHALHCMHAWKQPRPCESRSAELEERGHGTRGSACTVRWVGVCWACLSLGTDQPHPLPLPSRTFGVGGSRTITRR